MPTKKLGKCFFIYDRGLTLWACGSLLPFFVKPHNEKLQKKLHKKLVSNYIMYPPFGFVEQIDDTHCYIMNNNFELSFTPACPIVQSKFINWFRFFFNMNPVL